VNNHFFIDLFEQQLSEFTGAPYVVLTDSCTNAIFLSLVYLNRYRGYRDTVVVPKQTYVSVPQAIMNAGFPLLFEDEKWYGQYKLKSTPIVDAAVGFSRGMYSRGMVCLSFQQKKALSIGKGGAILLDDQQAYNTLKRMSWDGRDASISVKDDLQNIIPGFHMNMIPDDAATGVLKLNNYAGDKIGSYQDYPDISVCFNGDNLK
jgi:dTDP-4-amino-4,6-dideoxygalactose transaminase